MKKNIFIIPIVLCFVFFACNGSDGTNNSSPSAEELEAAYQAAIVDAETAEASEIFTDLTAITATNPDLLWDGVAGESRVFVVTWTAWDGYTVGDYNMGDYNAWVTVVPEAQDFCQSYTGDDVLRMEELLGLPPGDGKLYFVEIWVSPDNLFRPSPDPEITDTTAGLDFPEGVSAEYEDWFNEQVADSYGADGYPWTRLGYTCDWIDGDCAVGLSEFVINQNADVMIDGIYTNEEYCE